jgi:hypothetical protein
MKESESQSEVLKIEKSESESQSEVLKIEKSESESKLLCTDSTALVVSLMLYRHKFLFLIK